MAADSTGSTTGSTTGSPTGSTDGSPARSASAETETTTHQRAYTKAPEALEHIEPLSLCYMRMSDRIAPQDLAAYEKAFRSSLNISDQMVYGRVLVWREVLRNAEIDGRKIVVSEYVAGQQAQAAAEGLTTKGISEARYSQLAIMSLALDRGVHPEATALVDKDRWDAVVTMAGRKGSSKLRKTLTNRDSTRDDLDRVLYPERYAVADETPATADDGAKVEEIEDASIPVNHEPVPALDAFRSAYRALVLSTLSDDEKAEVAGMAADLIERLA